MLYGDWSSHIIQFLCLSIRKLTMRWQIQIHFTGRDLAIRLLSFFVRCAEPSRSLNKHIDSCSRGVSVLTSIIQLTLDRIFFKLCRLVLSFSHIIRSIRDVIIHSDELCMLCIFLLPLPEREVTSLAIP